MSYEPPMPNLPLLRKVLSHIDAHPEQWDQRRWFAPTACGAVGCIAGWATILSGDEPIFEDRLWVGDNVVQVPNGEHREVSERAQELLGLTGDESKWLFDNTNDREEVQYYAGLIAERAGEVL